VTCCARAARPPTWPPPTTRGVRSSDACPLLPAFLILSMHPVPAPRSC
jgi:hypothetical protein